MTRIDGPTKPVLVGRPTWDDYWRDVRNEDYLAARQMLDLSHQVRTFAKQYLAWEVSPLYGDDDTVIAWQVEAEVDWDAFAAALDAGVPYSSTETRLAAIVASLTTGRPVDIRVLGRLAEWGPATFDALRDWALF